MQDLTTVSSSSSLTTSNQPATRNLVQPLLIALGWKDLKPAIVAAEQADQALALELQQAYDGYSETPDELSKHRLQLALDQVIGELQSNLTRVQKHQKQAEKRLAKPQTTSSGYLASWGSWFKQGAQSFFGSDDASLVERYRDIAQQRQAEIAQLSQLRAVLIAGSTATQTAATEDAIEEFISPLTQTLQRQATATSHSATVGMAEPSAMARKLLQTNTTSTGTTTTTFQYCYPDGACELSALGNGNYQLGLALQGEAAGDYSGYSVSAAGDMNGDGVADLVVGAYAADPSGRSDAGKSYVIFGNRNAMAWGNGTLELSSLHDGVRGFVLQGEAAFDYSGYSVSAAGDVNGDDIADLVVGAYQASPSGRTWAGKSYVVFGSRNATAWGNGTLELSSLHDGVRGFVLQGEAAFDYSGYSVGAAGDINGDGVADLVVGAWQADPSGRTDAGKSYVVFGSRNATAWGNGTLELSNLRDGVRGFVLQGETAYDQSGISVSTAGDVDGDGVTDLVVGAPGASPSGRSVAGKSYVVFGSRNATAWGNGTLELSSLHDGVRGLVLQGEAAFDDSGYSVSAAGDVNGDGVADLVVGAYRADPSGRSDAGKSYVIFGNRNATAWGNGTLELSSLHDGVRGLVLQGEVADDFSGSSVSAAGDVNGDGVADLVVGAYQADPSGRLDAGKSYVIFGNRNATAWGNGTLELSSLRDGVRGFVLQGEAADDNSGISVNAAGDINGDGVADLVVGAYRASPSGRNAAGKSYVVWGRALSISSSLQLTQGSEEPLPTDTVLPDSWGRSIAATYFIRQEVAGHFALPYQNSPGQTIPWFTSNQVAARETYFVHDGGDAAPSYALSAQASVGWTYGLAAQIGFTTIQQHQQQATIELSQSSDGVYGVMLQGEAANDDSGYSVSAAGDINGDGVADLVVGAYQASPSGRFGAGKSYVVFGSRNVTAWGNGTLELSSLRDGVRGFVLQGEAAYDYSGYSVSAAGDINGDGVADLVVGAYQASPSGRIIAGKSYVVFGSRNATAWGNGTLELSNLRDGVRGFVLQGEAAEDLSGYSVSAAGDINNDGIADLVVGAWRASPSGRGAAGKSYVVFGSRNVTAWGNGTLELSSLHDGVRGFVLQGEAAFDFSGYSVSAAGDINGDGVADLVVGAYQASPSGRIIAGKSYVVFGSRNATAWGNGTLELSNLRDGVRGFVLQGEAAEDLSGYSVSAAGDINGDGVADLVVGAYQASPSGRIIAGKSYVVFGSRNVTAWGNGTLELSSLHDGVRGFVLKGEAAYDDSGYSVSTAGDINGDGVADLVVGAYQAAPSGRTYAGKSYVVFGSRNATAWSNGTLELSSLHDGARGFALQGEAAGDASGSSVSAAGDINGDGVADLVVGAPGATPSGRSQAGKSYVVFGGGYLPVTKQQLPLRSGQTLLLTSQHLAVNYLDSSKDNSALVYTVSTLTHGRFEYVQQPGFAITRFTQGDINQGKVQFVHDGSVEPPVYELQVTDGIYVRVLPSFVHFNAHSVFISNTLVLNQGQANVVTPDQLAVSDRESPVDYLTLSVVDQRFGQFERVSNPGIKFSGSFVPANITAGHLRFVPDGSTQAPEYTLSISDNVNTYSERGEVNFNRAPALGLNQLLVDQGQATVLTSSDLSASDPDTPSASLQFVVSNLQAGQFQYVANGTSTNRFTQQAIFDGAIQFLHDGSNQTPVYAITVDDGRMTIANRVATITFNHAPALNVSRMVIDQGQATVLRPQDISATDVETFDEDIIIEVGNVTHGYFSYSSNPTFVIAAFRQFPLITGAVQFTQDGSNVNASFALRAFDGRIYTPWQMAQTRLNRRPVLQRNVSDIPVTQGELFSFDVGSNLFADPDGEALNYTAQLKGGAPLPKGVEFIPPSSFQGNLPTLTSYQIEVQAKDPRGLIASTDFALQPQAPSQSGIDLQKLYTSVSSIGGIAIAIAGYFWLRRKTTAHRRGFELANNLRKAANLEYHDFMRFDGDVFKSKVDNFLTKLDLLQPGFYKGLTPAEKKSFAVCIAEIVEQRQLLTPSGYGMGIYGWMLAFSVGWSQQLDFKKFESQLDDIAKAAVAAWQAEESPTTRWPYFSPTTKDKVNAFCCARPSRAGMFARDKMRLSRSEGVSLTDLKDSKHQVIDVSSSSQKDVLKQTTDPSSSPRFFDRSAATSEERLGLIEKQLQSHMQQVTEGMQEMRQEMAGNIKAVSERVDQLESRPLLLGSSSSSS